MQQVCILIAAYNVAFSLGSAFYHLTSTANSYEPPFSVHNLRWGLPTPNSFPAVTVLNIVKLVYNHMMIKTRFKSGIGPLISLCICNGWWNVANHAERRAFQFSILQKIYTSNSDSNLLLWEKPTLNIQLKHIMLSLLFCFNFIFAIFIITTFILYFNVI